MSATITLQHPVQHQGAEYTELTMRRASVEAGLAEDGDGF